MATGTRMGVGETTIEIGGVRLPAALEGEADSKRAVIFAHGSGSSRKSSRNRMVATTLREAGLKTLLFDLLTEREAEERNKVFDVHLLADRLQEVTAWLREREGQDLAVGLFGASTGSAAALLAASLDTTVGAVVSRGGRPDLVLDALPDVEAPTLLIVGGEDEPVIGMNEKAYAALRCEKEMTIVPGATHLFEEPGALDEVASQARGWFERYLPEAPGGGG